MHGARINRAGGIIEQHPEANRSMSEVISSLAAQLTRLSETARGGKDFIAIPFERQKLQSTAILTESEMLLNSEE